MPGRAAILLIASSLLSPFVSTAQTAPPPGIIEGTVVDSGTGAGIEGAEVRLFGLSARTQFQVTTDVTGRFRIADVPPGSYRASVQREGFTAPRPAPDLFTSAIAVAGGRDPVRLNLTLARLLSISGHVVGPDGTPIAGARVSVTPNINSDESITGPDGRFALQDLRPGDYTLLVRPSLNSKPLTETDGRRTALVTTYYPDYVEPALARQLELRSQNLENLEFRMQHAAVHRIAGRILDDAGKPVANVFVSVYPVRGEGRELQPITVRGRNGLVFAEGRNPYPSQESELTIPAQPDGTFEIPALPSGLWLLYAQAGETTRTTAQVRIGSDDLEDLELRIQTPVRVATSFEWTGEGTRVSPAAVLRNAATRELAETGQGGGMPPFLDLLPGTYEVVPMPGLTVRVFQGDFEVRDMLTISPGGPPLRFVAAERSARVRGTVDQGGGTVLLIPARSDDRKPWLAVTTNPQGVFEMEAVSPGDYKVVAFERGDSLLPRQETLSALGPNAVNVHLEERATVTVELRASVRSR